MSFSTGWQRLLLTMFVLAASLLTVMAVRAADPGSKEDPLATVSYVQQRGMLTLHEFPAGRSIRLGTGAELVLVTPGSTQLAIDELNPMVDELLDLTAGQRVDMLLLDPAHHYVNGSGHDIFIRPAADCSMLLRGEWK